MCYLYHCMLVITYGRVYPDHFFLLYWGREKGLVTLHYNFLAGGLLIGDDKVKRSVNPCCVM